MLLVKTGAEIAMMQEGGAILAEALNAVLQAVCPGVTTEALDELFTQYIRKRGAEPSFLGYRGYPKSICTSVNDEVVHAIPSKRTLCEGDIVGIDCGVRYRGFCTDMARTVPVGQVSGEAHQLIAVAEEALRLAIPQLRPGHTIGDIGATVQEYVESHGFSVVRDLVGHGVGRAVHEEPQVPNFGRRGKGQKLRAGMVLAIEPMINVGTSDVVFDEEDGWTVRTADGSLSAHCEDTIAITAEGPVVCTTR